MHTLIKHIVSKTYKPLLEKYLSRTRVYRYRDIRLEVAPEVFHPGFFFSTQLLLQYINRMDVRNKKLLELGCGSGLISIVAARNGALVTASDINPVAISMLKKNSCNNDAGIQIIRSDLFQNIPAQQFDIIAINPPYYKKNAVTAAAHAWFCGENGEYFSGMLANIQRYMHKGTQVLMVLFEDADMQMIRGFAASHGLVLTRLYSKKNMLETNSIYKIETTA